ncbi:MAG: Na(+)-translocating NADH-quinone reductase subunit A [Alloprevotella sp.]|nr:Na(+)-translocating NADH-quinone reductase subunit A [Bacteroidales bacterium]MDY3942637.1 Na(+)-translocating NADH-quinone reductase subunit A [Alloprevotella sp.]
MNSLYKIKKGLDLRLEGEAQQTLKRLPLSDVYAIVPDNFEGLSPRLLVKEGDSVKAGSPLFVDKATGQINVVAPVSGTVKAVVRGERRKLLRIEIATNGTIEFVDHARLAENATVEEVKEALLKSGLFAFIKQRPYDVVAAATDTPKAIFVSAFSKMPLAASFSYVAEGQEEDFKAGIALLSKIAQVHVGICPDQINTDLLPTHEAKVSVFDGPNPSGNVGVHINRISPINKGEIVWTLGAEAVVFIGRFAKTGQVNLTRRIAVAGSQVVNPCYVETFIGAPLQAVLQNNVKNSDKHQRIINGNPLVGVKAEKDDFLGAFNTEVCVIPEGDDVNELFGWIMPRTHEFSTSRSYFSWLFGKNKTYDLDCRIKGGERHIIMSGEYDRVFPMDIFAGYLIKAIITGDIDRQEALGIYEVAPEDFAVAEFVDSSKLDLQRIVREGLDVLRKENA